MSLPKTSQVFHCTMFKRSVKRQNLRQKRDSDDSDEEKGGDIKIEPIVPPGPSKIGIKPAGASGNRPTAGSLLSFEDDDVDECADAGELLKAKKSSAVRRLEKYKKRVERRHKELEKSEPLEECGNGVKSEVSVKREDNPNDTKSALDAYGQSRSQSPGDQPRVLFNQPSAKGGGSKSKFGAIPDADAIFKAKKARAARRRGEYIPLDDTVRYTPNEPLKAKTVATGSRLVREDDNDLSDEGMENENDVTILATSKKEQLRRQEETRRDRQRRVLEAQDGSTSRHNTPNSISPHHSPNRHSGVNSDAKIDSGSESDNSDAEELRRWEREQMRKGVSSSAQLATHAAAMEMHADYGGAEMDTMGAGDRAYEFGTGRGDSLKYPSTAIPMEDVMEIDDDMEQQLKRSGVPYSAMAAVPSETEVVDWRLQLTGMRKRAEDDESRLGGKRLEIDKMDSQLEEITDELAQLQTDQPKMELKYHLFQEVSAYVRDLFDCYKEKVPQLEELEKRQVTVTGGNYQFLARRRRQDIRDQFEQCSGRPITATSTSDGSSTVTTRSSDREARRTRRRQKREQFPANASSNGTDGKHMDGESTDDEMLPSRVALAKAEMDAITTEARTLWTDVEEEFCNLSMILRPFFKWHQVDRESFDDAFIAVCLPKLCAPVVRSQMLVMDPFGDPPVPLETTRWHQQLLSFAIERSDDEYWLPADDQSIIAEAPPIVNAVPDLVEKSSATYTTSPFTPEFIHNSWDGTSRQQCAHLSAIVNVLASSYPTLAAGSRQTRKLIDAIRTKMQQAIDEDLFMPIYSKEVLDNQSTGAAAFSNRQFWFALKVLSNCVSLEGVLSTQLAQQLAIDGILNRHLVLGLQLSDALDPNTLLKCKQVVAALPSHWLKKGDKNSEKQLQPLIRAINTVADNVYKGRHNLRLEQWRSQDF